MEHNCYFSTFLGAVACVTLLDRLQGDFVSTDFELLKSWQHRAQMIVLRFIKKRLNVPWLVTRWQRGIIIRDVIDKMGWRGIPWLWSMNFIYYELGL